MIRDMEIDLNKDYLNRSLLQHQYDTIKKYFDNNCRSFGVFHDMGLGKATTSLSIACELIKIGSIDRIIVFCSAGLIDNWKSEIKTSLADYYHNLLLSGLCEFYSYNFLSNKNKCSNLVYSNKTLVILDESHNIKETSSNRTKNYLKIYKKVYGTILLSGTPLTTAASDLYIPSKILGLPYIKKEFLENFCYVSIKNTKWGLEEIVSPEIKDKERLMNELEKVSSWLKQCDVMSLPEQIFKDYYFNINTKQKILIDKINNNKITKIDKKYIKQTLSAISMILSGYLINPKTKEIIVINDSKINILIDIINSINEPVMVICTYLSELKHIRETLIKHNIEFVERSGLNTREEKNDSRLKFESGKYKVFLGTIQANNEGLNFQYICNHMILYTIDFNMKNYIQVLKRIHRIGSKNITYYHNILSYDEDNENYLGFDEVVYRAVDKKNISLKDLFETYKQIQGKELC